MSVESVHWKFVGKFGTLLDFLTYGANIWQDYAGLEQTNPFIDLRAKALSLENLYHIKAAPYLLQTQPEEKYHQLMTSENVAGQILQLMKEAQKNISLAQSRGKRAWVNFLKRPNEESWIGEQTGVNCKMTILQTLHRLTERFESSVIVLQCPPSSNDICENCHSEMILYAENSELRCGDCGRVKRLEGIVFDDSQFYIQDGIASKNKKYDPHKHCEKWMDNLEGRPTKLIPEETMNQIIAYADANYRRGGILREIAQLKCSQVRDWLSQMKLSKYNNCAPFIRQVIAAHYGKNIQDPQLSTEERQNILHDFSQATRIFKKIRQEPEVLMIFNRQKMKNNPYFPFFLGKIIQHHLKGDARCRAFLERIHYQRESTVEKNDYLWLLISAEMPGYTFQAENRLLQVEIF